MTVPHSRASGALPDGGLFDGGAFDALEPDGSGARLASKAPLTVSEALSIAKGVLESIPLTIVGEVSECSDKPGYKAVYFTLTDASGALSCLIWRNDYGKAAVSLRQGMLVEVSGSLTVYAAKGRMNFVARAIRPAGEGDVRVKVAQLARQLESEGLMDPARKLPVCAMPGRIAVITSPRGKAVHDVLRTLRRRFPLAAVELYGVPVEGEGAPAAMIAALDAAIASAVDTILLVRGGGSWEDLMPFNDERLARAIAASPICVVTGIGHEPDNSIADMVADHRASTPTAAAERAVPDVSEYAAALSGMAASMRRGLSARLDSARMRLESMRSRPVFRDDAALTAGRAADLEMTAMRLRQSLPHRLDVARRQAAEQSQRLSRSRLAAFKGLSGRLDVLSASLDALSPLAVLSRGYAVVYDVNGGIIDHVSKAAVGDELGIRVLDGRITARVAELLADD
jgi:exodeoxyribonuclease VII large subunit